MNSPKQYVTEFDSCSSAVYALKHFLSDREFKRMGIFPPGTGWFGHVVNGLPNSLRFRLYRLSGFLGAIAAGQIPRLNTESVYSWIARQYPERSYPAILIGSSNGAAIHIAAALGVPWLPQTFLLSCRRRMDPDDIPGDIAWGRKTAPVFLDHNPDIIAHQMHDPIQDRLMIASMGYFRIKKQVLGPSYESYLKSVLSEGGSIVSVECRYDWPSGKVSDRHFFQLGGFGDLPAEEYLKGGARIEAFLERTGSSRTRWEFPLKPLKMPEGEWGFCEPLSASIERYSRKYGLCHRRLIFNEPGDLSAFTAELYRWWYLKHDIHSSQLLVECFALLEPYWTLHTGSLPFWLPFNTRLSFETLTNYLEDKEIERLFLILISNGILESISIDDWKRVFKRASKEAAFLGIDERKYPLDIGSFLIYQKALKNKIRSRQAPPPALTIADLDAFVGEQGHRFPVQWL